MAATRITASASSKFAAQSAQPAPVTDSPKARRTRISKAAVEEPQQPKPMSAFEELAAAQERIMASFKLPTWRRSLLAFVASFTTGYFVFSGGLALVDTLLFSAVVATAPVFIQTLVAVLGIAITLWCAWKAGGYVGRFIFFGDADNLVGKGWSRVSGFFSRMVHGIDEDDASALQSASV